MNNFEAYSKYYDLLYKGKNYEGEAEYIISLINKYSISTKSILELGCGSGSHANYFTKAGFEIFGIERSLEMVNQALAKDIDNFYPTHAEIENFKIDKKFNVAISLFHVISYLTDNELLVKSFQNINQHLKKDGIFIFDVWYTPAVHHQKPETRVKRLENDEIEIIRIAESELKTDQNVVDVNFEILIKNKKSKQVEILKELHPMRHFSIPEIQLIAMQSNFTLIHTEEFLTTQKPTENTWGVCFILKKI